MSKSYAIIDFDDTLVDTFSFKEDLVSAVKKNDLYKGLIKDVFNKAPHYLNANKFVFSYTSFFKMIRAGNQYKNERLDNLEKDFNQLLKSFDRYTFPGSIDFLKKLIQEVKAEIIIFSYGESAFQKAKIKHSRLIEKVIQDDSNKIQVVISPIDKEKNILKLVQGKASKTGFFINDKIKENQAIKKVIDKKGLDLKVITKIPYFKEEAQKIKGIYQFRDFLEILLFIKDQLNLTIK
ncbi:MAG: hypothetical protein GF347_04980 [Candidatus Moranbacteria bacterium]|nr:hypothetical protein [Candidatus Moranbacteria bacterium]